MKKSSISRRDFLKLGALTLGSSAFHPFFPEDQGSVFDIRNLGRVATRQISLHSLPRDDARIIRQIFRDELLNIYYELTPSTGPAWNPLWYRVWGGYVHSAHIQKVKIRHNPIVEATREEGQIGEITVPYSQTFHFTKYDGWTTLYRLYYETVHWITGLEEGPDGGPWYEITDELGNTKYYCPAHHVRLIPDTEITPLSPDIPFEDKHIEVDLSRQTLTAYEGDTPVLFTKISSGITSSLRTNGIPTNTPTGKFNIRSKMPSKHMGEGRLTDNLEDYELVGVPWTAFFHELGYAIHGTYWHNNYGIPMSRGCINMSTSEAKWLFRWMLPVYEPTTIEQTGFGTLVHVF